MNVHKESISLLDQVQEQAERNVAEVQSAFERLEIVRAVEKNELEQTITRRDEQVRKIFCHNKMHTCRGLLVQWESICLLTQRSEFDSARWIFLLRPWQKIIRNTD